MWENIFRKKDKEKETNYVYVNKDQMLLKQNRILKSLFAVSKEKKDIDISAEKMIEVIRNEYDFDYCTLFIRNQITSKMEIAFSDLKEPTLQESLSIYINQLTPLVGDIRIIKSFADNYLSYNSAEERAIQYSIYILLKSSDNIIGSLFIEKCNQDNIDIIEEESFKTILESFGLALENLLLFHQTREMAIRDQLTSVYNRRYLYDEYIYQISKDEIFSVAILDIDFFKKVNDTYGHKMGDVTLQRIASYINSKLTGIGELFRIGGEEFIAYLPNINKLQAKEIMDNIRIGVNNEQISYGALSINVSVSIGVNDSSGALDLVNDNNSDTEEIKRFDYVKERADQALYKSKESGRNKVTIFEA